MRSLLKIICISGCTLLLAVEVNQQNPVCQFDDTAALHRLASPRVPGYFFRPFPNSGYVSYASARKNYLLDLYSGAELDLPGPYDPVPTPDERYLTIPPKAGISFYSMDDLKAGRATPLLVDDQLKGVYQSIGTVKSENGKTVYRVITDQDGLSFQDYEGTTEGTPEVKRLRPKPVILCKDKRISMPMLSKDGKQIAALDVDAGVTKIFDIDPESGKCTESYNLGIPTGKVDFSFDGDLLTFHVLNNNAQGSKYFEVPEDKLVANIYVLKRSTGQLSRLTSNTESNSNYPAFRKDGKVVYMNHPKRRDDQSRPSTFVLADPTRVQKLPFELISKSTCNGVPAPKDFEALATLGALWSQVCSAYGNEISAETSALNTLSLDPDRCQELVKSYWSKFRDKVFGNQVFMSSPRVQKATLEELKESDLSQACPKEKFVPTLPNDSQFPDDSSQTDRTTKESPIPAACMECHEDTIPFSDRAALKTERARSGKPFLEEILDRIERTGRGKMPPDRTLSPEEIKKFQDYLKGV